MMDAVFNAYLEREDLDILNRFLTRVHDGYHLQGRRSFLDCPARRSG
jgi:hypothetical protein